MKLAQIVLDARLAHVALLVSAWIETLADIHFNVISGVALLVSAWIETAKAIYILLVDPGRTPRECVD